MQTRHTMIAVRYLCDLPFPIACLLLLGSCGGNGSTSLPAASPTPTPSPIAIPTPTPTPTPTPSSTAYEPVFDFVRDRNFVGLITVTTTPTLPPRPIYGPFDAATISYAATTRAITAFDTTIVPGVRGATLTQTGDSLIYSYLIGTSPATLTVYRGSTGMTYVGYVRDDEQTKPIGVSNIALIGAPTAIGDLPTAGTRTYRVNVAEIGPPGLAQTLMVDAAARSIAGTITFTPTGATSAIDVVLRGVLDAQTGRLDGTVMTSDGALAGAFHGRLYGPSGTEIGIIFDVSNSGGNTLPGVLLGRAG